MEHNTHHGHFEAPREKRRLTGKQKGIIGIVLALAVLAGVATGIYQTLVKPPEKPQPVQEETQNANTQPEPEVKKLGHTLGLEDHSSSAVFCRK